MSNAVTPLAAVIVQSNLISNLNLKNSKSSENIEINSKSNETNSGIEEGSSIHERSKANSVGLSSSPSATSSSPTSSTSSGKAELITNQMTHQLPQQQVHQVPLAGLQYFQYPSNNSTTPLNVSPMSSMTSSPSTTNTPNTANSNASIHFSTQPHFYHHPQQPVAYAPTQHIHAFNPNYKDTRWLTLEVCREFQRNKCNRTDTDCKFAHPPPHVEIVNGKVIACYDSLKGKCTRKEPPCKYLHPPQHLKDQLLQNGKNNLVLRQVALAMMQQHNQQPLNPAVNPSVLAANPQLAQYATYQSATGQLHGNPAAANLIPTLANSGLAYSTLQLNPNGQPTILPMIAGQHINLGQQGAFFDQSALMHQVGPGSNLSPGAAAATANGLLAPQQRTDRLMICKDFQSGNCLKSASECQHAHPAPNCPIDAENSLVIVCVDFIKGKCSRETCKYFHPPEHLVAQLKKQKITNNAQVAALNAAINANGLNLIQQPFIGLNQLAFRIGQSPYIRSNQKNVNFIPAKFNYKPSTPIPGISPNLVNFADNAISLPNANSNSTLHLSAALASNTENAATTNLAHQEHSDHQIPYALDNGQAYMLPQYQVYHQVYQRAPNTPMSSNKTSTSTEENAQSSDVNKTASASATAVNAAVNANQVDVVPGKKRTHDAVEHDFIPVQNGTTQVTQSGTQVKRTAIADIKTGLPVFQSFNSGQANFQHFALAQQPVSPALNYSQAINFPLQYAPYISLPYAGHQPGMPRM
ncbi:muscleblind 2 isoform X1 [Brachionus plicatilis]|uniref:Muscleblind 2 isoform X1 n=1 Tax=Brachionus plicatilis TaxID=10195 RepID=A0A3M7SUC5_BRAPC|nr:muscleblind 2 isoform X1 [Brachionus plicatilis]